tara:strand:+ start:125 stop:505 length:381 start_codon:yes stop_codon:yes gene_type:complete
MNTYSTNYISRYELKEIEQFADKLFEGLGIDIAFTNHFYERLNDPRNGKQITDTELKDMFRDMFLKIGDKLSDMEIDTEGVINDVSSKLNIPFVLVYDRKNNEVDLVSKTIMRKHNFKTKTKKIKI